MCVVLGVLKRQQLAQGPSCASEVAKHRAWPTLQEHVGRTVAYWVLFLLCNLRTHMLTVFKYFCLGNHMDTSGGFQMWSFFLFVCSMLKY